MNSDGKNVKLYRAEVDRLLLVVCGEEEFPWFISDDATVFDVSTATEPELIDRIAGTFGHRVTRDDLRQPLWHLAARIRSPPN